MPSLLGGVMRRIININKLVLKKYNESSIQRHKKIKTRVK